MSDVFEIGANNNEEETILYLNGVFSALEILNGFTNDMKSIYVTRLYRTSGQSLEDLLRSLTNKKYSFKITNIDGESSLEAFLKDLLPNYIGKYISRIAQELIAAENSDTEKLRLNNRKVSAKERLINEEFNGKYLVDHVIRIMKLLLMDTDEIYYINVDWMNSGGPWYELYHDDIVFLNGERILHFHFGGSD